MNGVRVLSGGRERGPAPPNEVTRCNVSVTWELCDERSRIRLRAFELRGRSIDRRLRQFAVA
jgi:hypothetical protein